MAPPRHRAVAPRPRLLLFLLLLLALLHESRSQQQQQQQQQRQQQQQQQQRQQQQQQQPDPPPPLRFRANPDGASAAFKILQLTDIHLGEPFDGQDAATFRVLQTVLAAERPDLVVLSGDLLTGEFVAPGQAEALLQGLAAALAPFGAPWAVLFGNHDVAYYHARDGNVYEPGLRRPGLTAADRRQPLSRTRFGPAGSFGVSNYWLNVFDDSGADSTAATDRPVVRVLLLDTGGGVLPEKIGPTQVDWFLATNDPAVATVAFQHLPTPDMEYRRYDCAGSSVTGQIDPLRDDAGLVRALEAAGNVAFLAVGHNHGNSYCCPFEDASGSGTSSHLHFCFGRHSGYGGTPAVSEHGARVYELAHDRTTGRIHWRSYVRTELGRVIDAYYPPNIV